MVGIVGISAGAEGNIGHDKQNLSDIKCGIDELPDDVLINILSRLSLKESVRARILTRRWRYLGPEILRLDHRDTSTGKDLTKRKKKVMKREKFRSWVNTMMELYQAQYIEGVVFSFERKQDQYHLNAKQDRDPYQIDPTYDSWVDFAMQKEVRWFELNLPSNDKYAFPSVERLKSHYHGVMSSPFYPLKALRLVHVHIEDDVIHYFLASCPNLEELCIRSSEATLNLRVMDPPRLRVLEISRCSRIQSVKISAVNLVSLTYEGSRNILVLKKIPNLRELTISGSICDSFVIEPNQHWSVQLEKLVMDYRFPKSYYREIAPSTYLPQLWSLKRLEVQVFTLSRRSLLFFASLVNACPQLCKFRIELNHLAYPTISLAHDAISLMSYPSLISSLKDDIKEANSLKFVHTKLKVVEVLGYKGCSSEEQLLLALFENCPSIESFVIDTDDTHYLDHPQLINYFSRLPVQPNGWSNNHRANPRKDARYCAKHSVSRDRIPQRHRAFEAPIRSRSEETTRDEARKRATRLLSKFSQRIKSTIT